ncbi:hypothetical protein P7C73_g3912, partial [Tremellales sp. Uapishka_1]
MFRSTTTSVGAAPAIAFHHFSPLERHEIIASGLELAVYSGTADDLESACERYYQTRRFVSHENRTCHLVCLLLLAVWLLEIFGYFLCNCDDIKAYGNHFKWGILPQSLACLLFGLIITFYDVESREQTWKKAVLRGLDRWLILVPISMFWGLK